MLRVSAVCVSRRRMFDAPGLSSAPRPQALLSVGPLGVAPLSGPRMGAGTSQWLESQSPLVLSAHRDGSRPGAHPKGVSARNGVSHSDDARYRRNASLWVRATGVVLAPENHGRKQTTPMTAAIPASPIGLRRPARQGGDGGAFPGRLSPNTPAPRPRTGSTDDGNDNPGRALVTGVRHPAQTRGVFEARATGGHFGPYARLRRTGSMSHVDPGGPTASPRHSAVMGSASGPPDPARTLRSAHLLGEWWPRTSKGPGTRSSPYGDPGRQGRMGTTSWHPASTHRGLPADVRLPSTD